MTARSMTTAGLAASVLLLAGCSSSLLGGGDRGTAAPAVSSAAPATAPATASGTAASPPSRANPLATIEAPIPLDGDPRATVMIDLLGLERQGKLLVLTAAVTPHNSLAKTQSLYTMFGGHSWHPQLVDVQNLKLYQVVSAGQPLQTSDLGDEVASGFTLFVQATFAAPPPDVATINVQMADQVPAFTNVPIR
jgi:hypothetical protein